MSSGPPNAATSFSAIAPFEATASSCLSDSASRPGVFISNTVTAVLMAPIALQAAHAQGISAVPVLMAVTVAASMCFASPFSTPPNALVMSAGGYKPIDYVRVGLPLQIVIGIVMVLLLPLIY